MIITDLDFNQPNFFMIGLIAFYYKGCCISFLLCTNQIVQVLWHLLLAW